MDPRAVNLLSLLTQLLHWDRLKLNQTSRTELHQRPLLQIANYQEDIRHDWHLDFPLDHHRLLPIFRTNLGFYAPQLPQLGQSHHSAHNHLQLYVKRNTQVELLLEHFNFLPGICTPVYLGLSVRFLVRFKRTIMVHQQVILKPAVLSLCLLGWLLHFRSYLVTFRPLRHSFFICCCDQRSYEAKAGTRKLARNNCCAWAIKIE